MTSEEAVAVDEDTVVAVVVAVEAAEEAAVAVKVIPTTTEIGNWTCMHGSRRICMIS